MSKDLRFGLVHWNRDSVIITGFVKERREMGLAPSKYVVLTYAWTHWPKILDSLMDDSKNSHRNQIATDAAAPKVNRLPPLFTTAIWFIISTGLEKTSPQTPGDVNR